MMTTMMNVTNSNYIIGTLNLSLKEQYELAVKNVEDQFNEFMEVLEDWKVNHDDFESFGKYCNMKFEATKRKNEITFDLWSKYVDMDFNSKLTDNQRRWFDKFKSEVA